MSWSNLKSAVAAVVRNNDNQEITGNALQGVLNSIIDIVGENATFAGLANPGTNPGTPDGPVFYLASQQGTYSNFNNITIGEGLYVFIWNGSTWAGSMVFAVDDEPTAGSNNLVKSGGVYNEFSDLRTVINENSLTLTAGTSGYTDFNYKFIGGRLYHIQNQSGNIISFVNGDGQTVIQFSSNSNRNIVFREDVYGPKRCYDGTYIITPINNINNRTFDKHIRHSTSDDANMFIRELYIYSDISSKYDTIKIEMILNGVDYVFRIIGNKNNSDTVLVDWKQVNNIPNKNIYNIGIGYIIIDADYKYWNGVRELQNFSLEHNPRISDCLDINIINKNIVVKNVGINLIENIEWGKAISAGGSISTVDNYLGITNKIYFKENNYITCNNFLVGVGVRCAIYDETDSIVSLISPTNSIVTVEKINSAAYAIFTVTSRKDIAQTPAMAQYGNYIDGYQPYSVIGGYLPENKFYCGESRKYKKLTEAILAAESVMDSILYVDEGEYDIYDELGADFFENLSSTNTWSGIPLKNRIHIVFSPNSIVKLNYPGNNEYVLTNVSIFQVGRYGFTLEGCRAEGSRIRYIVHDDINGHHTDYSQHKYLNCNLKIDNSQGIWSNTCIGGGLGLGSEVMIQGCVFDAHDDNGAAIYYHQFPTASANGASHINIVDNYIKNGYIELSLGTQLASQLKTIAVVSNNSVPQTSVIDESGIYVAGTGANTEIYSYNNQIRNN